MRDGVLSRVPAGLVEDALLEKLRRWSGRRDALLGELTPSVRRITLHRESAFVDLAPPRHENWTLDVQAAERCTTLPDEILQIQSPVRLCTRGGRTWLISGDASPRKPRPDRALIAGQRRAHAELRGCGIDMTSPRDNLDTAKGLADPYLRNLSSLAFLAPDIQRAILEGRQPAGLTLATMLATPIPLDWHEQRKLLGFETSRA